MVDHRTRFQKLWAIIAGVVLLLGGVVLGAITYGDARLTAAAGIVAVIGLALLRYALLRRLRARRG